MNRTRNQQLTFIIGTCITLGIAFLLEQVGSFYQGVMRDMITLVRHIIHMVLLLGWMYSINMRIINKRLRYNILMICALMFLWMFTRTVRWYFVPNNNAFNRFLWYMYYIPMVWIPYYSFSISYYLGKPENYNPRYNRVLLVIPAFILSALALTNDYHRYFFDFPLGIEHYDMIYTHEWCYYLTYIWIAVLELYFVIRCVKENRIPTRRNIRWLPIIVFPAMILYSFAYNNRIIQGDFTAVSCITIVFLVESEIQIGVLPSNHNYGDIFKYYTNSVWITDRQLNIYYVSNQHEEVSHELFEQAIEKPLTIGNHELRCYELLNGYVFWLADVSRFNRLITHLEKIKNSLDENNDLLAAEVRLQQQEAKIHEQERLFNELEETVNDQLNQIQGLVKQGKRFPDKRTGSLQRISILGTYIKRRCNLMMLLQDSEDLPVMELLLSIRESIQNLQAQQVSINLEDHTQGFIRNDHAQILYALFEEVIEGVYEKAEHIHITLDSYDGQYEIRMQITMQTQLPMFNPNKLVQAGGKWQLQKKDNDTIVVFRIPTEVNV